MTDHSKKLAEKFQELSSKAVQLKLKVENSKTDLSKKYYTTKLTKVNKQAYNVLAQMMIINAKHDSPLDMSIASEATKILDEANQENVNAE